MSSGCRLPAAAVFLPFVFLLYYYFQPVYQVKGSRAMHEIIFERVVVCVKRLFVVVWELCAVLRAHIVYAAQVVFQELAGLCFVHPITRVFFLKEPLVFECLWRHAQVSRYACDI